MTTPALAASTPDARAAQRPPALELPGLPAIGVPGLPPVAAPPQDAPAPPIDHSVVSEAVCKQATAVAQLVGARVPSGSPAGLDPLQTADVMCDVAASRLGSAVSKVACDRADLILGLAHGRLPAEQAQGAVGGLRRAARELCADVGVSGARTQAEERACEAGSQVGDLLHDRLAGAPSQYADLKAAARLLCDAAAGRVATVLSKATCRPAIHLASLADSSPAKAPRAPLGSKEDSNLMTAAKALCQLELLDISFYTVWNGPGGRKLSRRTSAIVNVPASLDVDADPHPDLIARMEFLPVPDSGQTLPLPGGDRLPRLGGKAVTLHIQRAPGETDPLPVSVELIANDPSKAAPTPRKGEPLPVSFDNAGKSALQRDRIAFGYDARDSRAPSDFLASVVPPAKDDNPARLDLAVTPKAAGSRLTVIGGLFNGDPAKRRDPIGARLTYAPVPTKAAARLTLSKQHLGLKLDTTSVSATSLTGDVELVEGDKAQRARAVLHPLPASLKLDHIVGPDPARLPQTVDYEASAPIDRLTADYRQETAGKIAQHALVRARGIPTRMTLRQTAPAVASFRAPNEPLGSVEVGYATGGRAQLLPRARNPYGYVLHRGELIGNDRSFKSVAGRVDGLKSASFAAPAGDGIGPVRLETQLAARTPFTIKVDQPTLKLDGHLRDLPLRMSALVDPAGKVTYNGFGDTIDEIAIKARATGARDFFSVGGAGIRHIESTLRGLPPVVTASWGPRRSPYPEVKSKVVSVVRPKAVKRASARQAGGKLRFKPPMVAELTATPQLRQINVLLSSGRKIPAGGNPNDPTTSAIAGYVTTTKPRSSCTRCLRSRPEFALAARLNGFKRLRTVLDYTSKRVEVDLAAPQRVIADLSVDDLDDKIRRGQILLDVNKLPSSFGLLMEKDEVQWRASDVIDDVRLTATRLPGGRKGEVGREGDGAPHFVRARVRGIPKQARISLRPEQLGLTAASSPLREVELDVADRSSWFTPASLPAASNTVRLTTGNSALNASVRAFDIKRAAAGTSGDSFAGALEFGSAPQRVDVFLYPHKGPKLGKRALGKRAGPPQGTELHVPRPPRSIDFDGYIGPDSEELQGRHDVRGSALKVHYRANEAFPEFYLTHRDEKLEADAIVKNLPPELTLCQSDRGSSSPGVCPHKAPDRFVVNTGLPPAGLGKKTVTLLNKVTASLALDRATTPLNLERLYICMAEPHATAQGCLGAGNRHNFIHIKGLQSFDGFHVEYAGGPSIERKRVYGNALRCKNANPLTCRHHIKLGEPMPLEDDLLKLYLHGSFNIDWLESWTKENKAKNEDEAHMIVHARTPGRPVRGDHAFAVIDTSLPPSSELASGRLECDSIQIRAKAGPAGMKDLEPILPICGTTSHRIGPIAIG